MKELVWFYGKDHSVLFAVSYIVHPFQQNHIDETSLEQVNLTTTAHL